jgi:hypothetical protein
LDGDHSVPSRRSRRAVLGLALGATLGAAPIGLAATAKPQAKRPGGSGKPARRRRKPRYKVVTRTFRNLAPIVINDDEPATPYPALLTVAGLRRGKLLDLNVTLHGFTQTTPRDVDLLLVGPNGRSAVIMSDVGDDVINDEVTNLTLVLDDQAPLLLPATERLVSGSFRPQNVAVMGDEADPFPAPASFTPNVTLSTFTGINPNGTWRLFVVDDVGGDEGSLAGWSLTIKARVRV